MDERKYDVEYFNEDGSRRNPISKSESVDHVEVAKGISEKDYCFDLDVSKSKKKKGYHLRKPISFENDSPKVYEGLDEFEAYINNLQDDVSIGLKYDFVSQNFGHQIYSVLGKRVSYKENYNHDGKGGENPVNQMKKNIETIFRDNFSISFENDIAKLKSKKGRLDLL